MNRLSRKNSYHALVFPKLTVSSRVLCRSYSIQDGSHAPESSDRLDPKDLGPESIPPETNIPQFVSMKNAPRLTAAAQLGPPTQVACYSRLAPHIFRYNENSCLRRFKEPPLGVHLFGGMTRFFERTPEVLRLLHRPMCVDPAIHACLERPKGQQALLQADVVITKGAMVNLLYGYGSLSASYIDGKLYLEEHDAKKLEMKMNHISYAPYRFKRFCTELYYPSPKFYPPTGFNDWVAVVSRTLGGLNLLVAGTVPCVTDQYIARPECYLDLRSRCAHSTKAKIWKHWFFASHSLGIPAIHVGYRDGKNMLLSTERIQTDQLPELVNRHKETEQDTWNPEDNIDKCFRALYVLRNHFQEAVDEREFRNHRFRDNVVWRVDFLGRKADELRVRELRAKEVGLELDGWADIPDRTSQKRVGMIGLHLVRRLQKLQML